MEVSKCDSKGRLFLDSSVRSRYGERFFVVELPSEILLLPVPADPIPDLEEIGEAMADKSIHEIKKMIRRAAKEEALSDLRR